MCFQSALRDKPQGIILNDLQAFYADNESVAADIDPQLSSIIGNLTKARLPEEKLKAKLDGYTRPVDTRVGRHPRESRDLGQAVAAHTLT